MLYSAMPRYILGCLSLERLLQLFEAGALNFPAIISFLSRGKSLHR